MSETVTALRHSRLRLKLRELHHRIHLRLRSWLRRDPEMFAPHGIPVRMPASVDPEVRYALARGWDYEAPEVRMIRGRLRAGMNVLELGGSLGIASAVIRERIGPDAHHLIVEAVPELAEICRMNASRGAVTGAVEVVNATIDHSGKPIVRFVRGNSSLMGHVARGETGDFEVPTTTLATLADRMPAGPYALVCDIEGAELGLVGCEAGALSRVSMLIMEIHPRAFPGGEADLGRLIATITGLGLVPVASEADVHCFVRPAVG